MLHAETAGCAARKRSLPRSATAPQAASPAITIEDLFITSGCLPFEFRYHRLDRIRAQVLVPVSEEAGMARSTRRGVLFLTLAAAFGVTASGQQSQPTFKTDVNAIMVDFRVVDQNGAFVGNLTP